MQLLNDYGTITSREKITQEMIDDILCSAFEGGISYWASHVFPENNVWPDGVTFVSECLSRGVNVCIKDLEEDDIYLLTLPMFVDGLSKAVEFRECTLESFCENHDAFDADLVVQFALFGRIIYG